MNGLNVSPNNGRKVKVPVTGDENREILARLMGHCKNR